MLDRLLPRYWPRTSGRPPKLAPTRLTHVAEHLFGREAELAKLDATWADPKIHVVTLVAWGGVGKTSLVAKWAAEKDLGGADYFDWSFYSQGTREEGSASGEPFIAAALRFFGEEEGEKFASSAMSGWEKGAKLATFVARRKALLILDGLEPLQYPPSSPKEIAGQLKDPGVTALLRGLAAQNPGLCVVTTRESVKDLAAYRGVSAPEWSLERLSTTAGVAFLEKLQVKGRLTEKEALVEEMDGHALTLQLLGSYLHDAHESDVRKRDLVGFEEADREIQGGHAFRTIEAYERWFLGETTDLAARQLAVLRLLGLFDRPADQACLLALRREPAISGLTDSLVGVSDGSWNVAVSRLADRGLVSKEGATLDAHPLVREYFARQLREKTPEVWHSAHGRLFEHLRDTTPYQPDTLEGLEPLYQAVSHGCHAERQQETLTDVYRARINRGSGRSGYFSVKNLGAFGADLGAIASFFESLWRRVSPLVTQADQAALLNDCAFCLRALGRLTEAQEPMRDGFDRAAKSGDWKNAAKYLSNLSELALTLGDVPSAVRDAEEAVAFAERSGNTLVRIGRRSTYGDALHHAGRRDEALALFREAERVQVEDQSENSLPYSLRGFQFCDLLLAKAELAARGYSKNERRGWDALLETIREVEERVTVNKWRNLQGGGNQDSILMVALDHLTLGRAALYRAILSGSELGPANAEIEQAVDGLRRAGTTHHIPRGLLTRAWLLFLEGNPAAARANLDEAQEIAERGPMPLYLADIALCRGRLFGDRDELAVAKRLIEKHGYGRRLEELADAEEALGVAG
ncbi:MAG: hypothetical protein ABJC13_07495 [Acidobacteriota bacterium]